MNKKTKTSKELMAEFVNRIQSEESFSTTDGEKWMYYASVKVGKAKYVYGDYFFSEKAAASLSNNLELTAIIAGGKIYLMSPYKITDSYDFTTLPENTIEFSTAFREMQKYIKSELLQNYMDTLEIPGNLDEYREDARGNARRILLGGERLVKDYRELNIHEENFASYLCGFTEIQEQAYKVMEEHKKEYMRDKAFEQALQDALADPQAVEDWELRMAKALRNTDAKNVTATFLVDGKEYEEKMLCDRLLYCLQWNCTIDNGNCFSSWNHGREFLSLVHADSSWKDNYRPLTHQDITTIKYRGKIIYEKKKGEN